MKYLAVRSLEGAVKHADLQRLALLALVAFPLLLTAGCPVDATSATWSEAPAGTYWVEQRDGDLAVYQFPTSRDDTGVWRRVEITQPEWYTGPALYVVSENGTWTRSTTADTLTLDDVLLTYDPAPRVGGI